MNRTGLLLGAMLCIGVLGAEPTIAQEGLDVLSSGAVSASCEGMRLNATVGQPVIGLITGAQAEGSQGFWQGTHARLSGVDTDETQGMNTRSLLHLSARPNLVTETTTLSFTVPETQEVFLALYNTLGQHVQQVVDAQYKAGPATVEVNMKGLPTGSYTAVLRVGKQQETTTLHFVE